MQTAGKTASPSQKNLNVRDRIHSLQNALLDRVLAANTAYFAIICAIILSNVMTRRFPILQFILLLVLLILTFSFLYRNKIAYNIKLIILISLVTTFAIVNLFNFGLIGGGRNFLMFSILFTAVFATRKATAGVFIISILLLLTFMFLFVSGHLHLRFDLRNYTRSYHSWIIQISSFMIYIGVLVLVTSSLFKKIQELATESSMHVEQIRTMNNDLEQKVELRTRELKAANKSKDIILGIVAHDIRNKLTGVIGSLDLLTMPDSPPDENESELYINLAKKASNQTLDIVTDLLEYAKIESGEIELPTEQTNVHTLIAASIDAHRQQADLKNIIIYGSDVSAPLPCLINFNKISRVMDNLMTNAIKFTPEGGTISVEARQHENSVIISVTDSGIGIPETFRENLFSAFSKSGRPGTSNEPSTGLGLSICKRIIELHNGRIWFESTEGEGTTFFVELPQGT